MHNELNLLIARCKELEIKYRLTQRTVDIITISLFKEDLNTVYELTQTHVNINESSEKFKRDINRQFDDFKNILINNGVISNE